MKKRLLVFLTTLLSMNGFAQIYVKASDESLVKMTDGLYASRYEVSNKLYRAFLTSLKQSNQINLLVLAQIDTLKWTEPLNYNPPYAQYYHTHPGYDHFPVVNISYQGATLFCDWLTEQYNEDPKRKFKKVRFRLPTEKEWIMAAKAGDSTAIYAWKGNALRNKKGQVLYNFKRLVKDTLWVDGNYVEHADVTAPVRSYWQNSFGLYNMSGNVAEMVQEQDLVKGGSWRDDSEYLKVDQKNKYDGNPQPTVGFRYFAEVLEK